MSEGGWRSGIGELRNKEGKMLEPEMTKGNNEEKKGGEKTSPSPSPSPNENEKEDQFTPGEQNKEPHSDPAHNPNEKK